jgi:hypothetical protein
MAAGEEHSSRRPLPLLSPRPLPGLQRHRYASRVGARAGKARERGRDSILLARPINSRCEASKNLKFESRPRFSFNGGVSEAGYFLPLLASSSIACCILR